MTMLILLLAATLTLTAILYMTRDSVLGWPSAGFWALTMAQSYSLRTAINDIYMLLALISFAMVLFCLFAVWSLHGKKDDRLGGKDVTNPEEIEMTGDGVADADGAGTSGREQQRQQQQPVSRSQGVRDRAEQRRSRIRW